MKILCITHSSRPFLEARSTSNELERRFHVNRFDNLPPLNSFKSIRQAVPFEGGLTLWQVDEEKNYDLRYLTSYTPEYKIQYATFYKNYLLIYASDRLDIVNTQFKIVKSIYDPWLVGGHTVFADEEGLAYVTSAPANAILVINIERGKVVERIPIPELYGRGYPITTETDLRDNFIPTDYQPTHINCAYPWNQGLLISLFIPGVLGFFDERRKYQEIACGYRGCHGGRYKPDSREFYLTDSATGTILFFDSDTHRISQRYHINTLWLHDSCHIDKNVFAFTLTDKNRLQLMDIKDGTVYADIECNLFGKSAMFVNFCEVNSLWEESLIKKSVYTAMPIEKPRELDENETVLSFFDNSSWIRDIGSNEIQTNFILRVDTPVQYEYLLHSEIFFLEAGNYYFDSSVKCMIGGVTVFICDAVSDAKLASFNYDTMNLSRSEIIAITESAYVKIIITANNPAMIGKVTAEFLHLSLRKIKDDQNLRPATPSTATDLFKEWLPAFTDDAQWTTFLKNTVMRAGSLIQSKKMFTTEYLLMSSDISVPAGRFLFEGYVNLLQGNLAFGLLDMQKDAWITQLYFQPAIEKKSKPIELNESRIIKVILSANNVPNSQWITADISRISLKSIIQSIR